MTKIDMATTAVNLHKKEQTYKAFDITHQFLFLRLFLSSASANLAFASGALVGGLAAKIKYW